MSFLSFKGYERFNGETKTVFRNGGELIYTVNPSKPMNIIDDRDWYNQAALQAEVWSHNIDVMLEEDIPLSFEEYRKDMMFCEVEDERIEGRLVTPAIIIEDFERIESYDFYDTFKDVSDDAEEEIKELQKDLTQLIEDGMIAVKAKEAKEFNDYTAPGSLRQFGDSESEETYLLDFGEWHPKLEGPYTGQEFLEEHNIVERDYGVRSPIMLGDMSEYAWQIE